MEQVQTNQVIADRLRGAVWGLLVGDALGVPYEFHEPHALLWSDAIEMEPPAGFDRAHWGTPSGTWSDDGAHALCLLASLLERGRFDPDDLASRLLAWREDGYMAVDGRVFDCGIQTSRALDALQEGASPLSAGPSGEYDNGNGSLMRVLPLALWHEGPDAELVELAHQQSQITHGHDRSLVCCALYCLWARRIVDGEATDWSGAVATLRELYGDSPLRRELSPQRHERAVVRARCPRSHRARSRHGHDGQHCRGPRRGPPRRGRYSKALARSVARARACQTAHRGTRGATRASAGAFPGKDPPAGVIGYEACRYRKPSLSTSRRMGSGARRRA
jgi:ADP-ribosylglycohydrolase